MHINFTRTNFNDVIVHYDPTVGLKEEKKTKTGFSLLDNVIKFFRHLFSPNTRLSNVIKGMELAARTFKTKQPSEMTDYIRYVNIFKEQVIEKHNKKIFFFQNPFRHNFSIKK